MAGKEFYQTLSVCMEKQAHEQKAGKIKFAVLKYYIMF